ncbi:MAG TPA: hypothetical protein VGZ26_10800 [Pirellulales bacterium]|jgi:L-asparagine transporter-like permease|nr:hypothetical protein [Pirellulales bacterium]
MESLLHYPQNTVEWVGVIVLAGVVGGLVIGAIAVVTDYYRGVQRDEMDATLKMEMLQRGMSAEEITQVLKATSVVDDSDPWGAAEASKAAAEHCREQRRALREAARSHRNA